MIDYDRLPAEEQNRIADRDNLRTLAAVLVLLALWALLMNYAKGEGHYAPGAHLDPSTIAPKLYVPSDQTGPQPGGTIAEDDPGWWHGRNTIARRVYVAPDTGVLRLYSGTRWTGRSDMVETMAENRGWCVRAPFTVRSVKVQSDRRVTFYRGTECTGKTRTVSRSWVADLGYGARSFRIR